MEIRALELENVKSYERETIAFSRGTNAICGPNGAGKSTILEAIGFALFDSPPCRPIGNWVREGQKTAAITITVAANDEREYQVVRRCGSSTQYYVYDSEIGQRVVDGAVDVLSWLKEQFGVDESVDLAVLFRDAVGVPQGLLTAAFLLPGSGRKGTFDPLLRVEEYNQAWKELLEAKHALDGRIHTQEREIAGFQAEVKALPDLEAKATSLEQELAAGRAHLTWLEEELAALDEQKQALEAARDHVQRLAREVERLDERLAGLRTQQAQAARAVEQALAAQRIVLESTPGHQAYLAAQEKLAALEAERAARDLLQHELGGCRTGQQVAATRLGKLEEDLQEARSAQAEAERLQAAAAEQESLEAARQQALAQAEQWQAAQRRLEGSREQLGLYTSRLAKVQAALAGLQRLKAEREVQRGRTEALTRDLEALFADQARRQALLTHLGQQHEALARIAGAQCPVCEGELAPERQQALLERNRQQAGAQTEMLAILARRADVLQAERQAANQTLESLERQIADLPRPGEREALEAEIERQQQAALADEAEVARLEAARQQAQDLAAQLNQLGDPRRAYQRALDLAGRQLQLEDSVARERARAEELAAHAVEVETKLAAYARLDDDLKAARAGLRANEPLHQRYLSYQREATDLPKHQEHLVALQAGLDGAESERQTLAARLAEARAAYDEKEYERVAEVHQQANSERSALSARLDIWQGQLQEVQQGLAHLHTVSEQLQNAERELSIWRELGQTLEYLRKILKEAGPQITKALVEIISHQAARLYADIISDQNGRLRWMEDYEVLVEHKGYARTFQQLSGGEQMAAALAVRLALLHEISAIDIVFFDEPTSNLDDTRRDNLADQILGIKDFTQLFVVSHDDTFERATDHTVRIAKEDGASKVVG